MVTSLRDGSKVIIWPMKDGNGERMFELAPIVSMSFHPCPWDSNIKNKTPPNPPQQETPIPCMPHKQTPQQLSPGPSSTQWSEDSFRKPPQYNEPPIPGPSPSYKPHEDVSHCEPEPELAPTQSLEEPFG
ncbi:hypothetical protein O181_053647 [Austropuccinia psidii MF-1]|uniref:Uncharacterized protein n=1 Tax=Austropuccinia psidii MF-1 TaxID=1389203 RepID=A0A9Q3EA26_9BASI|nr:hypothetical protein [Austropuccinia psidii MF-1]